ncbi:TPA: HU family DNA-binding protein [Enterobacter hormaechei subsp. steigerwaltii]|nr:HU family DNA-binding protein [Enterobacter hormaechei subsp. steigerwaltii]
MCIHLNLMIFTKIIRGFIRAGRALDALIASVTESLQAGDDVALVGFGTFAVKERAARTGRNPQTGKEITIAAAKVPGFRAGKALKDAVN